MLVVIFLLFIAVYALTEFVADGCLHATAAVLFGSSGLAAPLIR